MRGFPIVVWTLPLLLLAALPASGDEPSKRIAAATEAAQADKPAFTPPPGFRSRKRGQLVVYCRREEPKGTRFPAEVCYDEAGLRAMQRSQVEDQAKIEQMRRVRAVNIFH